MLASSVIKLKDEETVLLTYIMILLTQEYVFSGISSPLSLDVNNPLISIIINNWCLLFKYLLSFCFHILSTFSLKFMYIYFKCCIHVII